MILSKGLKRYVALFMAICMVCSLTLISADDLKTTYEQLKGSTFVTRLKDGGTNDEDIENFLEDLDSTVKTKGTITESNFNSIMYESLMEVIVKPEHSGVYSAMLKSYATEIAYTLSTGSLHESLIPLRDAVKKSVLKSQDNESSQSKDSSKGSSGSSGKGGSSGGTDTASSSVNNQTVDANGAAKVQITAEAIQSAVAASKADGQGIRKIPIEVPGTQAAKAFTVEFPSDALFKQAASEVYEIKTNLGTVELPSNMLADGTAGIGKSVALTIAKADTSGLAPKLQAKIASRPVVELTIKVDGTSKEWSSEKARVKIALDYKPTAEELNNPEHIIVYYIDGKGNASQVPNGRYDAKTGKVVFEVAHFSKYAVAYGKKSFADLDNHLWAKKQIEVMTSKGIIKEAAAGAYNPGGNITRAEFVYGLINALGLNAKAEGNFEDVKAADYYYDAVAAAKKLGVVNGVGGNKFLPTADITRQEMMVMTVRALSAAGKINTANKADLSKYADNEKISAFAREGVANLVGEQLIKGDGKNINPQGNVTRAEGAVIMYRVYYK